MRHTPRNARALYEQLFSREGLMDYTALLINEISACYGEGCAAAEALYLLEPETGPRDPLMPFGHTWWRIGITDIVDIQLVPAEGQLRLCTSLIFERDAHLRNMPGAAGMRHWHDVIRMVWTARSENSLKSALDNCLPGVPERPPSPGHGLTSSKTRCAPPRCTVRGVQARCAQHALRGAAKRTRAPTRRAKARRGREGEGKANCP